jgi:hypothetical protein
VKVLGVDSLGGATKQGVRPAEVIFGELGGAG